MEEFTTLITSIGQLLGTGLEQVRLTFFYRKCHTVGLALFLSMFTKPQKLTYLSNRPQLYVVYKLINHEGFW